MCKVSWKDLAKRAVSEALALFVGPQRAYTHKTAAEKLGCAERSLVNWRQQNTAPALEEFLAQCSAFGPEYVNSVLAHVGMTGARWLDPAEKSDRLVASSVARLGAEFAEALIDGHIDHQERVRIEETAQAVVGQLEQFIHEPGA